MQHIFPHELLVQEWTPLKPDLRRLELYDKSALKRQTKSLALSLKRETTDVYGSMFELPLIIPN